MLLDLCRGKRHPKTPYVFDQTGALRIQDRDHGRYLTAFPKHGHRGPHEIDGRLENQDGLLGRQPARMIREESSLDSELRSPHPHPTEKGSQRCGRQDRRTRPRPVENQESNSGESAEQDGREGHGKSAAPKEGVQGVDTSACGLVDQCGAAEAPPSQLPEGSPSFFTSYEVSCENTCLHCMQYSLLFRQWPPARMNDGLRQHLDKSGRPFDGETPRRLLREELKSVGEATPDPQSTCARDGGPSRNLLFSPSPARGELGLLRGPRAGGVVSMVTLGVGKDGDSFPALSTVRAEGKRGGMRFQRTIAGLWDLRKRIAGGGE